MSKYLTRDLGIIFIALLLASVALVYCSSLKVTTDNRVFYHEDNPLYAELVRIEETFELYSNITFLISSKITLSTTTAEAIQWLADEVEQYVGYVRHTSLDNYPHLKSTADDILVSSVLNAACSENDECRDITNSVEFPEIGQVKNRLLSADAKSFATSIAVDIGIGDNTALSALTQQIENTVQTFRTKFPSLSIAHTGAIPMMQAFSDASNQDLRVLFPVSIVLMLVVSTVLFGSFRFALAALTCSILNVILVMGLASYFGLTINSATATLPLALLVISISASAHLVCYIGFRMQREMDRDFPELVSQACNANRTPILMSSLTTCVGLAMLSFVDIPPFREFGLLAAIGTVTNYFIVIGLLPAILKVLPNANSKPTTALLNTAINQYAHFVDAGRLPIKWVIATAVLAALGIFKFSIDEDYVKYFDHTHEFRIGADLLSEKLASPYNIEISIEFGDEENALNPENLDRVKRFQNLLRNDRLVVNDLSVVQQLELAEKSFGDPQIQKESNYIEQLFLAYELSLPPGHSTNTLIDAEHKKIRVSLLLGDASSAALIELENRIYSMWEETSNVAEHAVTISVTGETLPLAHLSRESLREVLTSLLACLALLSAGVLFSTRNILLSAISVGAVVSPLAIAFGSWSWIDSEFGLATSLVIAVTIGIIIDDTIHFLHRYQTGFRKHELTTAAAITYAIHHSAAGIITSSLILVSGFLVLCFSTFAVNQQFGIGVSLTIASALALTLVVLPAVLITFRPSLN